MSTARRTTAVLVVAGCGACGAGGPSAPQAPVQPSPEVTEMPSALPALTPLEAAVKSSFRSALAESIFRPAVYNDPRSTPCSGTGHLTTTAYLPEPGRRSRVLSMYMTRDATAVTEQRSVAAVTPAGTFRVLVGVVNYPETIGAQTMALWEAAQSAINADHVAFAASRGFAEPIVRFESTNVLIEPAEVVNPKSRPRVLTAIQRKGISTEGYDFVAALNLDPSIQELAFASLADRFVYVGNFRPWTRPPGPSDWTDIARGTYHHEVGHHWGWRHEWSQRCHPATLGFEPLITAPVLFGWEDVDGDGVPEILDATPYGRSR